MKKLVIDERVYRNHRTQFLLHHRHLVERIRHHHVSAAYCGDLQHGTLLHRIITFEESLQYKLGIIGCGIGKKTQMTAVDTQDGDIFTAYHRRSGEECAVTSDGNSTVYRLLLLGVKRLIVFHHVQLVTYLLGDKQRDTFLLKKNKQMLKFVHRRAFVCIAKNCYCHIVCWFVNR